MENQITKGKCFAVDYFAKFELIDESFTTRKNLLDADDVGYNIAEENADLAAQGINVTQETGKTPRQLADENKMLLEALKTVKPLFDGRNNSYERIIIEAINKATK